MKKKKSNLVCKTEGAVNQNKIIEQEVGIDAPLTLKVLKKMRWDPDRQTDGIRVKLSRESEQKQRGEELKLKARKI